MTDSAPEEKLTRPITHEMGLKLVAILERRLAFDDQTAELDDTGNITVFNIDRETKSRLGVALSADTQKYVSMTYIAGSTLQGRVEGHKRLFETHTLPESSEKIAIPWLESIAKSSNEQF